MFCRRKMFKRRENKVRRKNIKIKKNSIKNFIYKIIT